MKKILIFGASGFIGKAVLKTFKNYKIYCVNSNRKITEKKNIKILKLDLDNTLDTAKVIDKLKIDYCINLAWYGIPNFSKNNLQINLELHKKIINLLAITKVKKIFFSGSCFEYKKTNNEILKENSQLTLDDNFGLTKIEIMKYAQKKLARKLLWGRIFYAYGPYQRSGSLIPFIKKKKKLNKNVHLLNPFQYCDYIHIDDIANAIQILIKKNKSGIYNICSSIPEFNYSISERILNKKFNPENISDLKISGFIGSNEKLKKSGWIFKRRIVK